MFQELKPYLTALAMPPTSLILLILIGALLIHKKPRLAKRLVLISTAVLWILSTNAFSVWLHNKLTPDYPLVAAKDLRTKGIQAVVVLGGGVMVGLPGGERQLKTSSLDRFLLGAELARKSDLPLVVSGGSGWGAKDSGVSEADIAEKVLQSAFGLKLFEKESQSRDTQENAANTWGMLSVKGMQRIVLVTHSTHMPRAKAAFEKVGFEVTAAAVGQPTINNEVLLVLFPSAGGLEMSQSVLREFLAAAIVKFRSN